MHIRMIEHWRQNSALHHRNKLHFKIQCFISLCATHAVF